MANPWLVLMRPANMVTSAADILAGIALAGQLFHPGPGHAALLGSTLALYAGGIVFNDVCDARLDAVERPERPIPSGQVSVAQAAAFGAAWLVLGIALGFVHSASSGCIAVSIAALALLYDRYAKHHPVAGPIVMGSCRGLNLLLGVSIVPAMLPVMWPLMLLPLLFIGAITLTSQGEVHGQNRGAVMAAMSLDLVMVMAFIGLHLLDRIEFSIFHALPFLGLWAIANFRAKAKAVIDNRPETVRGAVRTGILSLIPIDAAYAAGAGGWLGGLPVLILLPISLWLTSRYRVT